MIQYHYHKSINLNDDEIIDDTFDKMINEAKSHISKSENYNNIIFEKHREVNDVFYNQYLGTYIEYYIKSKEEILGYLSAFRSRANDYFIVFSH